VGKVRKSYGEDVGSGQMDLLFQMQEAGLNRLSERFDSIESRLSRLEEGFVDLTKGLNQHKSIISYTVWLLSPVVSALVAYFYSKN